jgi:hypothetical protein
VRYKSAEVILQPATTSKDMAEKQSWSLWADTTLEIALPLAFRSVGFIFLKPVPIGCFVIWI